MKFSQRLSIRDKITSVEFGRGIWNPEMSLWRDVIEDYLYISKKRINNKLSMFRLQLNILQEIITNNKIIDAYKEKEKKNSDDKDIGKITSEEYENDKKHINSEIFRFRILIKALREIADGLVWKYLNYHRAILYLLADKQPIEVIRPDKGTIDNTNELTDVFMNPAAFAIYNDITNFLRVGDVTQINNDGNIEIIEVKASKHRGRRITLSLAKMKIER